VYDLMECERGAVDGLVLDFLKATMFHKGDFALVSDGSCRLHPQLTRAVVGDCRVPQARLDKAAKWLASMLLDAPPRPDDADPTLSPSALSRL
jgi:hypothetical protein